MWPPFLLPALVALLSFMIPVPPLDALAISEAAATTSVVDGLMSLPPSATIDLPDTPTASVYSEQLPAINSSPVATRPTSPSPASPASAASPTPAPQKTHPAATAQLDPVATMIFGIVNITWSPDRAHLGFGPTLDTAARAIADYPAELFWRLFDKTDRARSSPFFIKLERATRRATLLAKGLYLAHQDEINTMAVGVVGARIAFKKVYGAGRRNFHQDLQNLLVFVFAVALAIGDVLVVLAQDPLLRSVLVWLAVRARSFLTALAMHIEQLPEVPGALGAWIKGKWEAPGKALKERDVRARLRALIASGVLTAGDNDEAARAAFVKWAREMPFGCSPDHWLKSHELAKKVCLDNAWKAAVKEMPELELYRKDLCRADLQEFWKTPERWHEIIPSKLKPEQSPPVAPRRLPSPPCLPASAAIYCPEPAYRPDPPKKSLEEEYSPPAAYEQWREDLFDLYVNNSIVTGRMEEESVRRMVQFAWVDAAARRCCWYGQQEIGRWMREYRGRPWVYPSGLGADKDARMAFIETWIAKAKAQKDGEELDDLLNSMRCRFLGQCGLTNTDWAAMTKKDGTFTGDVRANQRRLLTFYAAFRLEHPDVDRHPWVRLALRPVLLDEQPHAPRFDRLVATIDGRTVVQPWRPFGPGADWAERAQFANQYVAAHPAPVPVKPAPVPVKPATTVENPRFLATFDGTVVLSWGHWGPPVASQHVGPVQLPAVPVQPAPAPPQQAPAASMPSAPSLPAVFPPTQPAAAPVQLAAPSQPAAAPSKPAPVSVLSAAAAAPVQPAAPSKPATASVLSAAAAAPVKPAAASVLASAAAAPVKSAAAAPAKPASAAPVRPFTMVSQPASTSVLSAAAAAPARPASAAPVQPFTMLSQPAAAAPAQPANPLQAPAGTRTDQEVRQKIKKHRRNRLF